MGHRGLAKLGAVSLLSWLLVTGIAIDMTETPQEAIPSVAIRGEVRGVQYSDDGEAFEIEIHDGYGSWWLVIDDIPRLPSAGDEVLAICTPLDGRRLSVLSMTIVRGR